MEKWNIEVHGEIIPGIILTGNKKDITRKMRDLKEVDYLLIPQKYWFEKYRLIPFNG